MTLGDMCRMAARYTDRHDEMIKTVQENGESAYAGQALHYFLLFRDAINEAYAEAAEMMLAPDRVDEVTVPEGGVMDIAELIPDAAEIRAVYDASGEREIKWHFLSRFEIETCAKPGDTVRVRVRILPAPLENEADAPIFPESAVDPMVYVTLAAARMWQSERQHAAAQSWLADYYRLLRRVRMNAGDKRRRVLPRPLFR